MKDEIKEIKIGMYTTDEILDFMTNGEGRGFMGRSMYDAILDCITNLQQKYDKALTDLVQESHTRMKLENKITNLQEKYEEADNDRHKLFEQKEKAIENIDLVIELIKQQPTEDDTWILNKLNSFKYLLNGGDDNE